MAFYRAVFLCLLAVCASGCVTRADFEKVRRRQQEMRALLADTQVAVGTLNRRLDTFSTNLDEQGMGADATGLRALEQRVSDMESRLGPYGTGGPLLTGGGLPAGQPRTEAAVIAWRREETLGRSAGADETYREALQLYREGQAEQAVRLFREFLRKNPKSDLADNAQYWMGEAYYSRGDYNRAIIELNEVLLKYPQGEQVAGALLALATAFANSGDKIDARLILQKLISDHPESEEAQVGRKQLQALTE